MTAGEGPRLPAEERVTYRELPYGRIRSRALGRRRDGAPAVVVVMGMAVASYLMPGLAAFADWTEAHLVELPGFAGSGDPPYEPDVPGYGACVADWLDAAGLGRVVLVGHSSGTQVAAHAALLRPNLVGGLALASPTVDPMARSLPRLLLRWRLDGRYPTPGLSESHHPEWRRAGARRLMHVVHVHLQDHLEDVVVQLPMPVLVIRGLQDRLLSAEWARQLADSAADGRLIEVAGPHAFPWVNPGVWSAPVRTLARGIRNRPA